PEVLFTVAAGNGHWTDTGIPEIAMLSDLPNVMIVANALHREALEPTSYRGSDYASHVAIGTNVPVASGIDDYVRQTGTSLSSPKMARIAALMCGRDPGLRIKQIQQVMYFVSDESPAFLGLVRNSGLPNEHDAVTIAALTGMMRRGIALSAATQQLGLDPQRAARLGGIAVRIVPSPAPDKMNAAGLLHMHWKYHLDSDDMALLKKVIGDGEAAVNLPSLEAASKALFGNAGPTHATALRQKLGLGDHPKVSETIRTLFRRDRVRAMQHQI
ncbi:MAG: S8/S53 family peptidase, partial [Pseudomonadota bacterium]|nr:S8/S53 family peptidase [Pseudomonadota bacterium]